eukprot:TCALIF_07202-PA protein Name:"Similar to CUBN Cubilin (Canis familiaris)" AED:0.20 eAED:0.21 QI:0/0.76/0.57/0.97/0.85/0.88/35/0/3998
MQSQENPKIEVKDGHLTIQTPRDKNLTLVVSGSGQLNLLGDPGFLSSGDNDLGTSGNLEPRVARLETSWDDGAIFNTRLQAMEERMQRLETNRGQEDQESSTTTIRRLKRDVRRIKNRLSTIITMINNNECNEANVCQNGGTCVDTFRGYFCQCPDNWEGQNCERDVDECSHFANTDLGCQNGATCQNTPGSYRCHCPPDFFGIHCTRKQNDCTSGSSQELCGHGVCVNQDSGFTCICDQGWTSAESSPACSVDVDECTAFNPPCSKSPLVQCINTPGGFQCGACPPGYTGNGFYCDDINECFTNNGGCSLTPRVDCINTPGSRTCGSCPQGYQGNGQTCVYMGPCHVNNGGCSPMAVCFATANMVQCFCRPGYQGLGVGPTGCLPGSDGNAPGPVVPPGGGSGGVVMSPCASGPCRNGATCFPLATNFICQCSPGYSGLTCIEEIDECASQPCYNGGTCLDQLNGYVCQCSADFQGTNCQDQVQSCGGSFTGDVGAIDFPHGETTVYDHDMSCIYTITVSNTKVLNITFTQFNLEESTTCSYDFLQVIDLNPYQIRDGPDSTSQPLGKFCGSTLPGQNGTLITNQNAVHMWFRSDSSFAHHGFQLKWNVTDPVCGGLIRDQTHGTIKSPGYPGQYPHNRDCFWTIYAPYGKRIQFHFAHLAIETHANCSYDFLEVYDGTHHTPTQDSLGRFCNSTSPPPVSSSNSIATIHFHSDNSLSDDGFQISWAAVPGTHVLSCMFPSFSTKLGIPGCGGLLTEPEAEFSSPSHPQTYSHNLNCEWLIRVPIGDTIELSFFFLDIESHANCRYDFLEVRDGSTPDSPLAGRYCGTTRPPRYVSTTNTLFIHFKTDQSITGIGFRAKYKTVCGGEFTNPTGIISSPYHPNNYPGNRICQYVISQPMETSIHIEFIDFDIEGSFQCVYDYLEIRDGDNANSTLLGKYCGDPTQIPDPVDSTHNFVYLRFQTDGSVQNRGFKLNYTTSDLRCGGILKANHGVIQSPTDTENYPHGTTCNWIIQGEPSTIIRLTWVSFILERHSRCRFDYVDVFDNNTQNNAGGLIGRNGGHSTSPLIGRFCGNQIPSRIPSFSNSIYLRMRTDNSLSAEGFQMYWDSTSSGCGGLLTSPTGSITSPGYPTAYHHNAECFWEIRVSKGSKIQIIFVDLDLERHRTCRHDYVEVTDIASQNHLGKFCDMEDHINVVSTGNAVKIKFRADRDTAGRGFHLRYFTICNNELFGHQGVIESPNFPNPYPHNRNCTWQITAPLGNTVNITFSHFELENSHPGNNLCVYDFLEIMEASVAQGEQTSVIRICGSEPGRVPAPVATSKRYAFVKFKSDVSLSMNGFRLEYVINGCGEHFRRPFGSFTSPHYPEAYPVSVECVWYITTDPGTSIELTVDEFDMESHPQCNFDYLAVYGGPDDTSPQLTKLCQSSVRNVTVTASGNHMMIHFRSDSSIAARGFSARFKSKADGCGGLITVNEGVITSPNYPDMYDNHDDCLWLIQVDPLHRLELEFTDFDVEPHSNCSYDYVAIYNGDTEAAPNLLTHCGRSLPPTNPVFSTANQMLIRLKADGSSTAKGFKAQFKRACGATILTSGRGDIASPDFPHAWGGPGSCSWIIQGTHESDRVTLHWSYLQITGRNPDGNCTNTYVAVYDGKTNDAPEITRACSSHSPPPITSTGNALHVVVYSRHRSPIGSVVFRGTYTTEDTACGGDLESLSGRFTSPMFPGSYINGAECTWIIGGYPGNRISLGFSQFDLEASPNCNNDYVEIHQEGPNGPLLGHYCGSTIPSNITHGEKLWVKFRSNEQDTGSGFVAFYTLEYGNHLTGTEGEIVSPLFPRKMAWTDVNDPNEIVWTITVDQVKDVQISFTSFDITPNGYRSGSCLTTVTIFDGPDQDAPSLYSGCGFHPPGPFQSNGNVVVVRFKFSVRRSGGSKFRLLWSEVSRGAIPSRRLSPSLSNPDTSTIRLTRNSTTTLISSPGYPTSYGNNLHKEWIVESPIGTKMKVQVLLMALESSWLCRNDFLEIYDGSFGSREWNRTGKICRRYDQRKVYFSSGNVLKLRFVTDSNGSRRGFRVLVKTVCGGYLQGDYGFVTSPNYEEGNYSPNLDCEWVIRVRPGRKIEFQLNNMDILSNDNQCSEDYLTFETVHSLLQIRNGQWEDSPLILLNSAQGSDQNGRVCGSSLPSQRNSSSNFLYVKFHSDATGSGAGFKLTYRELGFNCGGRVHLSSDRPEMTFTSPNYPHMPPFHTECIWTIMSPPGQKIQVEFRDNFYFTPSLGCSIEGVELRDGGTPQSTSLGRFCNERPNPIKSSDNIVWFKYFTSSESPNLGFKAHAKIGACGGTIYTRRSDEVQIESPEYPQPYAPNLDCEWKVVGPEGHYLIFSFVTLDLPVASNCSNFDYVRVHEENNSTHTNLATLCGSRPSMVETYGSVANLIFHSNGNNNNRDKTGFIVRVNASTEECGGVLQGDSGVIESPGYPNGYAHHLYCSWTIKAPLGRSVSLQFEDLDLERPRGDECPFDKLLTYSVVAPNVVRPNSDFFVAVSVHDTTTDQDVELRIRGTSDTGQTIEIRQEARVQPDQTQIVRLRIGDLGSGTYTLSAKGNNPIVFDQTQDLTYVHKGYSVFIQTDKAIYRPGNVVKFRAIVVTPELKPSVVGSIDVKMQDGSGNLIKNWNRVFTTKGVFAGEIQLADSVVMGDWNITVDVNGQMFSKNFLVAEYVLPKFGVDIELPDFGTFSGGETTATIKANYHHGGAVKGEATIAIFPKYKSSYLQPVFSEPIRRIIDINGQVDLTLDLAKELKLKDDFAREIVFSVQVKEDLTERVQNNTASMFLYKHAYKMELIRTADAFKPGMLYSAFLKVAYQDNTPVADDLNQIAIKWGYGTDVEKYNSTEITIPEDGIVELQFDAPKNTRAQALGIEATYKELVQWFSTVPRATSSSDNYIQARLRTLNPTVGENVRIGISSTEGLQSFTYHIFSRGKLVFAETSRANNQDYNEINIVANSDMSPRCRVVVYYMRPDKEIVADSLEFEITGALANEVEVWASRKSALPNSDVTVNVKSKPNSFVGIMAVDKSVRALKAGHDIIHSDVISELRSYDSGKVPAFFPWFQVISPKEGSLYWYTGSRGSQNVFKQSGTVILTNGVLQRGSKPNVGGFDDRRSENRQSGRPLPPPDVDTLQADQGPALEYETVTRPPLAGPYAFSRLPRPVDNLPKVYLRNDLPTTWLFANATTDLDGQASLSVQTPDIANTSWVISAFSLDSLYGMGISETPHALEVLQPFIVKVDLPHSVKRGETVAVQMIVYNYLKREITAEVTLENPGGKSFLFGSKNPNSVDDKEPDVELFRTKRVPVNPGRGTLLTFIITPIEVGITEMKITAKSAAGNDVQVKKLLVEAEGVPVHNNTAFLLDLRKTRAMEFNVTLDVPEFAVPGSERVYISAVNDPIGPTINNLKDLLYYPLGCGEQNMLKMIPALIAMQYLQSIGKAGTSSLQQTANYLLEDGYQRQLVFKLEDGSFSSFGSTDRRGSIWVTSLVARYFEQASPYVDIDSEVVTRTLEWLTEQQQPTGAFAETGENYNHRLQEDDKALTAFVSLAFMDNAFNLDASLQNSMNRAISFLAETWSDLEDPYILSIVAYVLERGNHPQKDNIFVKLESKSKVKDNKKWWEIDLEGFEKANPWTLNPNSANIEMTSYGLLTLLHKDQFDESIPVANWLLSQQNENGGFASTTDSFVAIHALLEFNKKMNSVLTTTKVDVQYSYLNTVRRIELDTETSTVMQKRILPQTTREIQLRITGIGMAVVQVGFQYNLNVTAAWPSFVVNPQVFKPSTANHMQLTVCANYIEGGDSRSSNMAVMEVSLPSGFTANMDALPALRRFKGVKRVDTERSETKVVLYFEQLTRSEVCPTISAYRTHRVANQKPSSVLVYDYYDQSRVARSFYDSVPATLCDICQGEDCPDDGCPTRPSFPTYNNYFHNAIDNVDTYSGVCALSSLSLTLHSFVMMNVLAWVIALHLVHP